MSSDNKRPKRSVEDDLICPITLELPFDPVTAEDGNVYERAAIENHFKTQQTPGGKVKSPITNQEMSTKLFAAPRIKNTIETLIATGVIAGDLASKWENKVKETTKWKDFVALANKGEVSMMEFVGHACYCGIHGFEKDKQLSFEWYDKARVAGSIPGLTAVAMMLRVGEGVGRDEKRSFMYLCLAAEKGSDWAASFLGRCLAAGDDGLSVNKVEAVYWLEKSLLSKHKIMTKDAREGTRQCLGKVKNIQA